ncbi:MAG: hypothetical protein AAB210_01180 [Deltaproteobacteria bacterium]
MKSVMKLLGKIGLKNEKGQTVIEYILVIALVVIALALVMRGAFTDTVTTTVDKIDTQILNAVT